MSVVREINFYLNSRERDPPSVPSRPASLCNWSLDVPITLRNPANYFQLCVRGFYADPGLVFSFVNLTTNPSDTLERRLGSNWIRAHNAIGDETVYLPNGNYTPQSLCDWANDAILIAFSYIQGGATGGLPGGRILNLDPISGKCLINEGNIDPTAVEIDFSITMYRALGFGASIYGVASAIPGPDEFNASDTTQMVYHGLTYTSPFPVIAQPHRTLFVLYNGGVVDSYSTSTFEFPNYPAYYTGQVFPPPAPPTQISSWEQGRSGGYKERRVVGAISLLSGNACEKIDYTAQNFSYSVISTPCITNISIELATENWQVVPIVSADYTIVLGLQECTPIEQKQPGIPQPIVLPKKEKGGEKDKKGGDGSEEYIRQLAQQIKQRRLQRAADMVEKSE